MSISDYFGIKRVMQRMIYDYMQCIKERHLDVNMDINREMAAL